MRETHVTHYGTRCACGVPCVIIHCVDVYATVSIRSKEKVKEVASVRGVYSVYPVGFTTIRSTCAAVARLRLYGFR